MIPSLDDLLADAPIRGRRVFVRSDLNVPLRDGRVSDDSRLRASLPTVERLRDAGARIVVASHLGRPKGRRRNELTLRPVAARLAELLGVGVAFAAEPIGPIAEVATGELTEGGILLLENLRFHPGETANDPDFARALARDVDVYVNDAFGTAHRSHASTTGMVPHVARVAAGDLLHSELSHLDVIRKPERPLLCLLGGAKVSDKLSVLEALAPFANVLAIGGAMAYTFLRAQGESTGRSLVEEDRLEDARRVVAAAKAAGTEILLPTDHWVASKIVKGATANVTRTIPDDLMGVDIGPETAARYADAIAAARTVFWNGPMGVFEIEAFAQGTLAVAEALARSSCVSVVGGGDSLAAVHQAGVAADITHLSTGGGASLEYIQSRELPGVAALEKSA